MLFLFHSDIFQKHFFFLLFYLEANNITRFVFTLLSFRCIIKIWGQIVQPYKQAQQTWIFFFSSVKSQLYFLQIMQPSLCGVVWVYYRELALIVISNCKC